MSDMEQVKEYLAELNEDTKISAMTAIKKLREENVTWDFINTALNIKKKEDWEKYGFGLFFTDSFKAQVRQKIAKAKELEAFVWEEDKPQQQRPKSKQEIKQEVPAQEQIKENKIQSGISKIEDRLSNLYENKKRQLFVKYEKSLVTLKGIKYLPSDAAPELEDYLIHICYEESERSNTDERKEIEQFFNKHAWASHIRRRNKWPWEG